jgi:hypothetical protein
MSIEQSMAEQVKKEYETQHRQVGRTVPEPGGLLTRAQAVLADATKLEADLQALLDRVRGSNIAHLSEAKEPAPSGLPAIFDVLERMQKNSAKLLQGLSDMF